MNEQQIKMRIAEVLGEDVTDAQRDEMWKLVVQVADFSHANGVAQARKLLRIQLGLSVPGDVV